MTARDFTPISPPATNGVIGVDRGTFAAYIGGQYVGTIYAENEAEALVNLADQIRNDQAPGPRSWYSCECGKVLDLGEDCPDCISLFDEYFNRQGDDILVNGETWLTRDLPATEGNRRAIEEAVI